MARTRDRHHHFHQQSAATGAGINDGKTSEETLESSDNDSVGCDDHRKGSVVDTTNEQLQSDEEIPLNSKYFSSQRNDSSKSDSEVNGDDLSPTQDDSSLSNGVPKRKPRSRDSLAFEVLSQSHATSVWSTGTNRILSQLLRPSQLSSHSASSQHSSSRSLPSSASKNSRRKTYDLSQIRNSSAASNDLCPEVVVTPSSDDGEILPPTQATGPLKGITCYVEVYSGQEDGSECVRFHLRELGAKVALRWSKHITHVIWKEGRQWTIDKARLQNCFLCTISWVESCYKTRSRADEKNFAVQFRNENGVAIIIGRKTRPRPYWLQLRNPRQGISMSADRATGRKQRRKRGQFNKTENDETPIRPLRAKQVSVTRDDSKANVGQRRRKSSILPLPSHMTVDDMDIETPEQMAARLQELRQRVALLTADSPDAMDFSCSPTINTPLSERLAQKYRERGEQVPRFLLTELNEEEENSGGKESETSSAHSKKSKATSKSKRTTSGSRNSTLDFGDGKAKSASDPTDPETMPDSSKTMNVNTTGKISDIGGGADHESSHVKKTAVRTEQRSSHSSNSTGKSSNVWNEVADDDDDASDSDASEEFSYFNRPGRRVLVPESNEIDVPVTNFDASDVANTSPEIVPESFEAIPSNSPTEETPAAADPKSRGESPESPAVRPLPQRMKIGQFAPILKRNVNMAKEGPRDEFGDGTGEANVVRPRLGPAPSVGLRKRRLLVETLYDSPADEAAAAAKPSTSSGSSGIGGAFRPPNRTASNRLSLLENSASNLETIDELEEGSERQLNEKREHDDDKVATRPTIVTVEIRK